ncbi:hypothetical protein GCM10010293_27420 [Streptomyces griseoflavus]|nr:hypothetical protein GCM10010293_27420 [Streptomyces griseoflavus]
MGRRAGGTFAVPRFFGAPGFVTAPGFGCAFASPFRNAAILRNISSRLMSFGALVIPDGVAERPGKRSADVRQAR